MFPYIHMYTGSCRLIFSFWNKSLLTSTNLVQWIRKCCSSSIWFFHFIKYSSHLWCNDKRVIFVCSKSQFRSSVWYNKLSSPLKMQYQEVRSKTLLFGIKCQRRATCVHLGCCFGEIPVCYKNITKRVVLVQSRHYLNLIEK